MKQLDEMKWEAFTLTDIFSISATSSSIDRCKLNNLVGDIPYITRSEKDNGWDSLVCPQNDYEQDSKNVITIGLDTQTVFYQPCSFYTGQNVQILSNSSLNKYVALFIIPLLKLQMRKFNWGGNGATLSRLKKICLMLPVSAPHTPDYAYMEEYMCHKEKEMLTKYKKYIDKHLSEIKDDDLNLGSRRWKDFFLEDIFTISSSIRLTKDDMVKGARPFIGASDSNNGVTAFVGNTNNSLDRNVLGVNYNGSVVENFYHPYEAIFSDDVKRLHLKDSKDDKYVFLFIKQSILMQKCKYEYGYKFNGERMKRQKIMLPVTSSSTPDYAFMSQYMQNVEVKQLKAYIDKRLSNMN